MKLGCPFNLKWGIVGLRAGQCLQNSKASMRWDFDFSGLLRLSVGPRRLSKRNTFCLMGKGSKANLSIMDLSMQDVIKL